MREKNKEKKRRGKTQAFFWIFLFFFILFPTILSVYLYQKLCDLRVEVSSNQQELLKIREAVGDILGANVDPSHLFWQGMDPVEVIKELGKHNAIYHFHAKDTKIDKYNTSVNGVLDTKHYTDEANRSWIFRAVGYGNGQEYWRDMISALRLAGYDKVMSIEHEDSLMSTDEGLKHAVDFLKESIIKDPKPSSISWA